MNIKSLMGFCIVALLSVMPWLAEAVSGTLTKANAAEVLPAVYQLFLFAGENQIIIKEHADLKFDDYPDNCLECHQKEAEEISQSTHYQWEGQAPDMVNGTGILQGKLNNAVNSYCVHILGNWPVCGGCHAGRGKRPDDPEADQRNIDCLVCHSVAYAEARTRLDDGSIGVEHPTDEMVRAAGRPARANCLKCHAYAGGGNGVKRGDLSYELVDNTSARFDVHMNMNGTNLSCQRCHDFQAHRVIGKGSDIRPTDDPARGAEVSCTTCHAEMADTGHERDTINTHTARVACQSCHIPIYAKVPTETDRDWRTHHDGTDATTCSDGTPCPGHPLTMKAENLVPAYKWWDRRSDNVLLYDDASRTYDTALNTYPTSRPLGDVTEGKLYPFKYKTASQPITSDDQRLIALDTYVYLMGNGNVTEAVTSGLANMGYAVNEPYEWITTDTYQLLNHGVEPSARALSCSACHDNTNRMDLQGELGYGLNDDQAAVCTQCHEYEEPEEEGYEWIHEEHVAEGGYDCSWCHRFSRPERGLQM